MYEYINYFERSARRHDDESNRLLEVYEYYETRKSYDYADIGDGLGCGHVYEVYAEYTSVKEF